LKGFCFFGVFMNMKLIFEAKKPDEQVTAELQALYPQWDFSNVEYYFDKGELSPNMKGQRYLNNLYCPIKDENGNPHGVSNNLKVSYLYRGEGGCRECRRLSMGPKRVDFDEYVKNFPKDRGYNFDQSTFYRETRGNTIRRYVKDVFCTKKDENGNTHGVFAKDGVNIDNLRQGKTGCPICRKAEGSIGEKKLNDILIEKGYKDFEKEKKFSDCKSGKESNRCTRLKFDFYLKDKENREILVEYDGEPHFKPNAKHGGETRFKERVNYDTIKNQYTSQNNIKLIRIAYTDFNNIEKELLAGLESPNQLYLSSNYPKLGWNDPSNLTEQKLKKEYIITESQLERVIESQHELLSESSLMDRLKRRVTKESFMKYILETQEEFPDLCGDYDDEYEYSGNIIAMAIEHFFAVNEDYFTENSYEEFIDRIFALCQSWYGDDLMEYYLTACVDDNMMNEAVDIEPNKVIVKLFKILNTQKSNYNNKRDLQTAIKDYLPYFGIDADYASYILELYLLNYREDGDYSSLTKDNFIDPRKMKGKRTPNYNAKVYTKAQLPFEGSNLRGYWRTTMDGKIYIVESYGWYPVYIFKDGKWYETSDRYSSSTGKQMYASQPYRWNDTLDSQVYLLSRQEMEMIERGATHEKVMELKRKAFRELAPSLISQKVSTAKSSSYGMEPKISIKFKISSVEDIDDKNVVNVDIQDVLKVVDGKQVPTPENYLKGEIPNVTPEKVEKQIETKLRNNFQNYLGPKFSDKPEEENIVFRFNHLKK